MTRRIDAPQWLAAFEDDCSRFAGPSAIFDVFGRNACKFYRMGELALRTIRSRGQQYA